jgi:hypothetical protein
MSIRLKAGGPILQSKKERNWVEPFNRRSLACAMGKGKWTFCCYLYITSPAHLGSPAMCRSNRLANLGIHPKIGILRCMSSLVAAGSQFRLYYPPHGSYHAVNTGLSSSTPIIAAHSGDIVGDRRRWGIGRLDVKKAEKSRDVREARVRSREIRKSWYTVQSVQFSYAWWPSGDCTGISPADWWPPNGCNRSRTAWGRYRPTDN